MASTQAAEPASGNIAAAASSAVEADANAKSSTSLSPNDADSSRPDNQRKRSSGIFGRLINRNSTDAAPLSLTRSISSGVTDRSDGSVSPTRSKPDIAALSKPTSKFKSHAKWDSTDITGVADEEPFMDTQDSPTDERKPLDFQKQSEDTSSGGTAAARALAQGSTFGMPLFPAQQRAAEEAAERRKAAEKAANEQAFAAMGFQPAHTQQKKRSSGAGQGLVYPGHSQRPISERAVNEAAQRVLQEARNAAMGVSNGLPPSAAALSPPTSPTGPKTSPPLSALPGSSLKQSITANNDSQTDLASKEVQSAPVKDEEVKTTRRKSMLSMPSFSSKKSKDKSRGPSRSNSPPPAEIEEDAVGKKSPELGAEDGTRRRRFADTRELDLLATELAAQVLSDQRLSMGVSHTSSGAQFMGGRRGSHSPSNNASQISLSGANGNNAGSSASSMNGHNALGGGLGPLSQIKMPSSSRAGSISALEGRSAPVSRYC